jgi:hypothetical protein
VRRSRWVLKSALIIFGAAACFGAGAALPQLTSLGLFERDRSQPSATTAQAAVMPATAEEVAPAASPDESKNNRSSRDALPDAKETTGRGTSPREQRISAPNDNAHLDGAAATPAAASPATAAAKAPPGPAQPSAPATDSNSADAPRADTQAADQHEGRTRSIRHSRHATHRHSTQQRSADREWRDPYGRSDWQRSWGGYDGAPFGRSWDRWRGRDAGHGWGRDPYDDYARAPNRRAGRRAGRGRGDEVPMMTFRPLGGDF